MRKKYSIIFLVFIVFFIAIFIVSNIYTDFNSEISLSSQVKYICQEIGPRPAASENEAIAAEYMASQFKKHGLKTEIQKFKYFSLTSEDVKESQNVVGTIEGYSPRQIIICADLDTVRDIEFGNYTEGANDDATSLSLLIGLAQIYQKEKPLFTIKLICFGASEDGFTYPLYMMPRNNLSAGEYSKIMYTPYLIGSRQYLLSNQNLKENTVAVISLEAVGIGEPCFVSSDAFVKNDQILVDYLLLSSKLKGYDAHKIDFFAFKKHFGGEGAISHVYLPFSYANIPSTFLTCMNESNSTNGVYNDTSMPNYLSMQDNYENLVKNNGNEAGLEQHLDNTLNLVKYSIDQISIFYLIQFF